MPPAMSLIRSALAQRRPPVNLMIRNPTSKALAWGKDIRVAEPWPTEVRLSKDRRLLTVTFDNGESYPLRAEYLRVFSPSAEVQGHSPEQRKLVTGKEHVGISGLDEVGNYAVKLRFDDGHDTGLYTWGYLLRLGRERDARWAEHMDEVAASRRGEGARM
jgi:DUF971 family protein